MWRGAGGTTRREQRGGKDGPSGTVADLKIEFAAGISRFCCYGGASGNRPRVTNVRVPLASLTDCHIQSIFTIFLYSQPVNFQSLPRFFKSDQTKTGHRAQRGVTTEIRRAIDASNRQAVRESVVAVFDERARSNRNAPAFNS